MSFTSLIADSGATKAEWCLVHKGRIKTFFTQGISPYFLTGEQITALLAKELQPKLRKVPIDYIFYYGTGCANPANARMVKKALSNVFTSTAISVNTDLVAAARAGCGRDKGIACILGTGSNSCYYDGKKIIKNRSSLGYVLGDEGSGAYLGKKVVQHYFYDKFDDLLRRRFDNDYGIGIVEILDNVYKKPLPNRYLASFTQFLAKNRGHQTIEKIIHDGLNDFFETHLTQYKEALKYPIHFTGSVGFGFKDVLGEICKNYGFTLGKVLKNPMEGLIEYHHQKKPGNAI